MENKIKQSLKDFNTFGIDSSAGEFIEVFTEEEVGTILKERELYNRSNSYTWRRQ
jgi:UDP-N-acetylenolpyruvoylglucosamine reductase